MPTVNSDFGPYPTRRISSTSSSPSPGSQLIQWLSTLPSTRRIHNYHELSGWFRSCSYQIAQMFHSKSAFKKMPSPPPSLLLSLPAEIRSLIFEYVVACPERVTFNPDSLQRQYYSIATQPPITRVSRQVRSESLPIYYETNDFVLHTEPPKVDDARRWLVCNAAYLESMRQISLWLRYVPLPTERVPGSGAIGISLVRRHRGDPWTLLPATGVADGDDVAAEVACWRWVTVTRKPRTLQEDIEFIFGKLRALLLTTIGKSERASPDDYVGLMMDLRMFYVQKKME